MDAKKPQNPISAALLEDELNPSAPNVDWPGSMARNPVLLAPLTVGNLKWLSLVRNHPSFDVRRTWAFPFTKEHAQQLHRAQLTCPFGISRSYLIYGRDDHQLLGECTLSSNPGDRRQLECQIHLLPEASIKTCASAIDFIFEDDDINKIYVLLPASAQAWICDLAKLGFVKEAVFQRGVRVGGEWQDECYMGLLAREWLSAPAT